MGILNVTPDSFSDGGNFLDIDRAVERAMEMIREGAEMIDIGPESTRPGSHPVSPEEQLKRSLPVIAGIRARDAKITLSIDTRSAIVAREAIRLGVNIVNDVSAFRDDPEMLEVVSSTQAGVILMHRRGTSADMQRDGGPHYDDVISEICDFLAERRDFATRGGIDPSRIYFDPGIGFGKRIEHNLEILRHVDRFAALGQPVVIGASRKKFIGEILGVESATDRVFGSFACALIAAQRGAQILRAHDVAATVQILQMLRAIDNHTEY
ncbi:MAG: dihydropteroate synthase [Planctomycetes bacterium]|nr:dihydropteroate synthase [Planctomycetota bacterium]MBI3833563.1 dihydropteroate synthase [Planctomycetota bacterium]